MTDMSSHIHLFLFIIYTSSRQAYRHEFLFFEVLCDNPLRVLLLAVVPLLSDSPSLLLMLACFAVTSLLTGVRCTHITIDHCSVCH